MWLSLYRPHVYIRDFINDSLNYIKPLSYAELKMWQVWMTANYRLCTWLHLSRFKSLNVTCEQCIVTHIRRRGNTLLMHKAYTGHTNNGRCQHREYKLQPLPPTPKLKPWHVQHTKPDLSHRLALKTKSNYWSKSLYQEGSAKDLWWILK